MTTTEQVENRIMNDFNKLWEEFVIYMNSTKKSFIRRLFNERYPEKQWDKLIAENFFRKGYVAGSTYIMEIVKQ